MNTRSQTRLLSSLYNSSNNRQTPSSSASSVPATSSVSVSNNSCVDNNGNGTGGSSKKIVIVKWLQRLLQPLLNRRTIGEQAYDLKRCVNLDDDVHSSAPQVVLSKAGNALGDQIKLSISYADSTLIWTFSFCWLDPSLPPEINFSDGHFVPELQDYQEFVDWDPTAADCFLNLVDRLFLEYRKTQLAFCESKNRLHLELENLRALGFNDKFDVYSYQDGGRRGEVVFVFPIQVEAVAELPAKFVDKQVVDDCARLKIKYTLFGEGKAHADVELTPFLNKLFNGRSLKLPLMQCYISEYVDEVRNILQEEVSLIAYTYKFKRDFIMTLVASYPRGSVIDFCATDFMSASFLLDDGKDFKYTVKVTLTPKFPVGAPSIQLIFSSVYHEASQENRQFSSKKSVRQPMTVSMGIPMTGIKPRASAAELVEKLRDAIKSKADDFKRTTCLNGV